MAPPRLLLRFDDPVAFATEYERNMSTGGAFVPTDTVLDLRETIELELVLQFRNESFVEPAEVVYCGPGADGRHGVAVQFLSEASFLREKLAPIAAEHADDDDRRRRRRREARIPATLETSSFKVQAHTRDLSESGVLLSADGTELPVGKNVTLSMRDPSSGEELRLEGKVARRVEAEGTVAAVGIHFEKDDDEEHAVSEFVERVGRMAAKRAGTGLAGNIQELGLPNLIQMLGASCQKGTLAIQRGPEEGLLAFETGQLRYTRLGCLSGTKALVRMLAWESGRFRFYSEVDDLEDEEGPLSLDGALLDAVREFDEWRSQPALPPGAVPVVDRVVADAQTDLSKTEDAVLELALVGMTVRRIHDIIPDGDTDVRKALHALLERGVITLREA